MNDKTAIAVRDPKPALTVGGHVAAIIPRSIEETFRLAGAIYASGMAPASLKNAEQVMVAIMAGAELGLAPFQSLQSFAVINGRPSIWGDGLMAVVRANGFKVREWSDGEGDALVARCEVTRPDSGEIIPGEFSVDQAKKAGLWGKAGPWQSYPTRMLKMRARAFALRDGAADVLRGFQIREEVEDYAPMRGSAPEPSGILARLENHGRSDGSGFSAAHVEAETRRQAETVDQETGEVTDAIIDEPHDDGLPIRDDSPPAAESPAGDHPVGGAGDPPDDDGFPGDRGFSAAAPLEWAVATNRAIEAAGSVAELDALTSAPDAPGHFAELQAASPATAKALNAAIKGKRKALADREAGQ